MSDSLNRRRRRNKREKRKARKQKISGLVRGIAVCGAGIILLTAGVLVWNGVVHREGPTPEPVQGLSAKVCYHEIGLSWQPAERADGYTIYLAEDGDQPAFARVGEVAGGENCAYAVEDYPRDQKLLVRVSAYGENLLSKEKTEGQPSEEVPVMYDSARYAQKIPVLTYHELIPAGQPVKSSLTVPEDMFRRQMAYLKEEGYQTLSMDEFCRWYQGKEEFPVKSCVITFDDGADNVYYLGYPILRENGQKSTIFCIGHHLEENGGVTEPFDPSQPTGRRFGADVVEKVRAEYPDFAFESHTYNMHKRIDGYKPVNVLSYDEMMEDFRSNEPYGFHYLAYPWGASNKDMRRAARDAGYHLAFSYEPFRYATRDDKPYRISRIKVSGFSDLDAFIRTVQGERPDDE